jgi:hypothetical protein
MTTTRPLAPAPTASEAQDAFAIRASAHAADPGVLRAAQRFQSLVTDLDVARVMLALERGAKPTRNRADRWSVPAGTPLNGMTPGRLSNAIREMVRTGLVRHYRNKTGDHLIPAPVHFRDRHDDGSQTSACLFVGEDLGPMRARLVDRLDLVDCLACEWAVSTGTVRGL